MTIRRAKLNRQDGKFDRDPLTFVDERGMERGSGFKERVSGRVGLIICPNCGRKNGAMNVLRGKCTHCDWDVPNLEFV